MPRVKSTHSARPTDELSGHLRTMECTLCQNLVNPDCGHKYGARTAAVPVCQAQDTACESCASWRSTRFTCFATRNHCRCLKLRMLAALLDFGACANAAFDNKDCCRHECRETLQLLEEAGIRSSVVEYLRRLGDLESRRPLPGGDHWQFQKVGLYREAVVRLSLGMVAATANGNQCLDEGIRATYCDADLNILFRIVMQCQIIDDVLDYSKDHVRWIAQFSDCFQVTPAGIGTDSVGSTWLCRRSRLATNWRCFPPAISTVSRIDMYEAGNCS